MIDEGGGSARDTDVELLVAPYEDSGLPGDAFDAVTALGLIEYLPDDEGCCARHRVSSDPADASPCRAATGCTTSRA